MQNPKTKLHMPNMLNEDIITKEEFEFKPLAQFQRPLKLLQRFAIVTSIFSIYQMAFGGLSFSYFPSSFNSIMAITSLLSLALSIFLVVWSTKTLKSEQNKTLLTQDVMDRGHERASRILFFCMILRAAASCLLIPNIMTQGSYTSQHLAASDFVFDRPQDAAMGTTLNSLALPLIFFEVFTSVSSLYAAWVSLRYIKSPGQMINTLALTANLALMGSSLALIYSLTTLEQYSQHPLISMLVSEWTLSGLMTVGIATAVMTGFVWLVNFRKWRSPSLLVTGVMILLMTGLGALTVSSYNNANSVSEFYQDTSDVNTWTFKMLNVHKKDIETFGCPSKYLPYDQCSNSVLVNRWELSETGDTPVNCLNMACVGLIGGLYSSPFLTTSGWSLATLISGLLVIAGSLYLWKTSYLDTGARSKKSYGWLGVLIAMVIAFSVATALYTKPYIQEKGLTMTDSLQGNGLVEANDELDRWFGGSGVEMDADIRKKISNLFLFKENRYIKMRLNKDYDRILFTEAGDYSRTYQDLVDNLNPYKAELALVKIPLDTRHDALVGIVWMPPSASPLEKVTYLKYYAVDPTDARSSKLGFPVYVATNKDDLEKNMVLTNVFKYRSIFLEDELIEVNQEDLIMQRQEMMTMFAEGISQFEISPEVSSEVAAMLMNKKNKFLVIGVDGGTINIKTRGDWQSSYDDFINSFSAGENEIGLLYLDVEGKTRLVVVMLINGIPVPDFSQLEQQGGVYFYIVTSPEELKLDNLMSGTGSFGQIQRAYPQFKPTTPDQIMERMRINLLEEAGPDLGLQIFEMIADQSSKYLLQRYNAQDKRVELVSRGAWNNSNYTTFVNLINPNEAQVGFIYLDLEDDQRLVLFIYAPESKYSDPKQVFKMFNLPSDPRRLESIGVHVYIARNKEALKIESLLKNIFGDEERITTFMQLIGLDSEPIFSENKIQSTDDSTSSTSAGNEFINTMIQKTYKYMILKKDPATNQTVISKTGDWGSTFSNFVNAFDRGQIQIGLVHIKLETITKLVVVIFVPPYLGNSDHEVLIQFDFSNNMKEYERLGVSLFSVQNKADLTVKRIVRNIYTNGPAVMNLLQVLLETDDEDDDSSSYTSLCATCGGDRVPGPSISRYAGDPSALFALDTEQMDEIIRDDDESAMKLIAKEEMEEIIRRRDEFKTKLLDTEQMEEIVRDDDEFKTKLLDTEQMEEVIRDRDELTKLIDTEQMDEVIRDRDEMRMELFGKMGLKLSRDIVKPLKSKKVKYVILKQDPENNGKPYIASNGTWYATFDQFVKEFDPKIAQVGFIYLEIEGQAKLVMVVYAPDPNVDAKQVIKDFKVTKKDAAKLKKKGISTFVVNSLTNLTLDNAMNSVYSQENQPIIKLMMLMEQYTSEPSLMYDINLDDIISDRKQLQLNMLFGFGSKGLKLSSDIRKIALGTDSKYAIVRINNETGEANVTNQGSWHSTFDQFARDFDPVQNQVGFIYIEIEQEKKLAMVVYAPNAGGKSDDEIIKEFGVANNVQKLENNDISVYFARNIGEITLDKVLDKVFNIRNPGATIVTTAINQDMRLLNLPSDIADAIQNKKYKYAILKHDDKKDVTTIQTTGDWGSEYKRFLKDFSGKKDQIAFINIDIEAKDHLVLIVYAYSYPPSQVLRNFGLPQDEEGLKAAGLQVYVARKKKDLGVLNVLQGVYSDDTFNQVEPLFMSLYEQSDLPLGKDVVDALTNKKYKYMILKHDVKTDTTTVESTGAWNSTYKAFVKDFTKKDKQIGFIFLEAEAKEILVLVVLAPKAAGTQVLREFGISDDLATLNKLGIKPYIAHKKKELDLDKVLEGVYSTDAFANNNPAIFLSDDEDLNGAEDSDEELDEVSF